MLLLLVLLCVLLQDINALEQHLQNLITPSTPYFFNTLYDPFREGADFVRGYPFSLREGVPTAISHGLWLNIPDYDAPTQVCVRGSSSSRSIVTRNQARGLAACRFCDALYCDVLRCAARGWAGLGAVVLVGPLQKLHRSYRTILNMSCARGQGCTPCSQLLHSSVKCDADV